MKVADDEFNDVRHRQEAFDATMLIDNESHFSSCFSEHIYNFQGWNTFQWVIA